MNIPPHWARGSAKGIDSKGKRVHFACWGWSATSQDEARTRAQERSERVLSQFLMGHVPDRYAYSDRPLREEILEEVSEPACGAALVTRNSYGSEILNVEQLMFVDVDLPRETPSLGGWLSRLFGRRSAQDSTEPSHEARAIARLTDWLAETPHAGVRVYRTHSGLRYLFTHALFDPTSEETRSIMARLGADPLYVTLCRAQQCFRARLTPKPWRCGLAGPVSRYPRESKEGAGFSRWLARYEKAIPPYATCRLVTHAGVEACLPGLEPLVALHDRRTRVASEAPLA